MAYNENLLGPAYLAEVPPQKGRPRPTETIPLIGPLQY